MGTWEKLCTDWSLIILHLFSAADGGMNQPVFLQVLSSVLRSSLFYIVSGCSPKDVAASPHDCFQWVSLPCCRHSILLVCILRPSAHVGVLTLRFDRCRSPGEFWQIGVFHHPWACLLRWSMLSKAVLDCLHAWIPGHVAKQRATHDQLLLPAGIAKLHT